MSRPTWYCDNNKRQADDFKNYLDARSICFRNTSRKTHPSLARYYCKNQECFDSNEDCENNILKIIDENSETFLDDSGGNCDDDDDESDADALKRMRKRTKKAKYDEDAFIYGKENAKKMRRKKSRRGGRKSRRKRRKSKKRKSRRKRKRKRTRRRRRR